MTAPKTSTEFFKPIRTINLKLRPDISEASIQQLIFENPALLGLGESVSARDKERPQPKGGRLDVLLQDEDADIRYEVEVQLGATDESHIIRTIEYWDVERKRYPNYDHVAVIVAEDITSRFFNVISLFNSAIPLIAIKLTAVENPDGTVGILFTRILDLVQQSSPDDDEPTEQTNRAYWDKKSSEAMLRNVDAIVEQIKTFEPKANLSYNKFYCGIWVDGRADNFVLFRPRRQFFHMEVKLPRSTEVDQMLEEVGLEFEPPRKDGRYRIRLDKKPDEKVLAVIREILSRSYQE